MKKWLLRGIIATGAALIVYFGLLELLKSFYNPENFRRQIIAAVKKSYGIDVRFKKLEFPIFHAGIIMVSPSIEGGALFANASRIEAKVSPLSILLGNPHISRLSIDDPMFILWRMPEGTWNVDSLLSVLKAQKESSLPDRISITGGHLLFVDDGTELGRRSIYQASAITMRFRNTALFPLSLKASAAVHGVGAPGMVKVTFGSRMKGPEWDWSNKWMKGKVTFENIDSRQFSRFLVGKLPAHYIGKMYSAELGFSGILSKRMEISGGASLTSPLPTSSADDVAERTFAFQGNLLPDRISLKSLKITLPEASVEGDLLLKDYKGANPTIDFKMSTSLVDITKLRRLVPPLLREEPLVLFIEKTVQGGYFKFSNLRFKGPYSSFLNLKEPASMALFTGDAHLEGVSFKFDDATHPIESVHGDLSLVSNLIRFAGVRATYGKSRLKNVAGTIDDLHGSPQLTAAIDADVDLKEFHEVLLHWVRSPRLNELITPVRDLSGSIDALFRLGVDLKTAVVTRINGNLMLNDVGFRHDLYRAVIEDLSGTVVVSDKAIDLKGATWKLGQTSFNASGRIADYSSQDYHLDFLFSTSGEVAKLANTRFFNLDIFKGIEGPVQTSLKINGNLDTLDFSHSADLTKASVSLYGVVDKPRGVRFEESVTGKVYDRNMLKLTSGNIWLGESSANFSGKIADVPAVNGYDMEVDLAKFNLSDLRGYMKGFRGWDGAGEASAFLHLSRGMGRDIALLRLKGKIERLNMAQHEMIRPIFAAADTPKAFLKVWDGLKLQGMVQGPVEVEWSDKKPLLMSGNLMVSDGGFTTVLANPINEINGTAILKANSIQFKDVNATIGNSSGMVSGSITVSEDPVFNFQVYADTLNLEDLVSLSATPPPEPPTEENIFPRLDFYVRSKAGSIIGLPYSDMEASFGYFKNRFRFKEVSFSSEGGTCNAVGNINISQDQPTFDTSIKVKDVDMESLFRELWPKMDKVAGKLEADGSFFGTGILWEDMRKTFGGQMKFRAEDGLLAQFSGLADIFSVVNIVPMFESRSGKQKGSGLPYKTITGSMKFKNGVGHTEDIFLEGNVVRMSGVGDFNFSKGEVDLMVGVKPFTTIDSIVSNIPIAGKLLTGEQKSLIVSYYRVTGSMENPKASAVPVESVARTLLGIITRVFEIPGRALSRDPVGKDK